MVQCYHDLWPFQGYALTYLANFCKVLKDPSSDLHGDFWLYIGAPADPGTYRGQRSDV